MTNYNADPDVLLKEVRRNQQLWGAINFWDAVVEIGGGFLGTLFFSYLGVRHANWTPFRLPDWDFLLVAFACAGLGTFRLVNRIVQRRKQTTANDPLKACIEASLALPCGFSSCFAVAGVDRNFCRQWSLQK